MESSRASFFSGVILGISLGLISGHFLIFSRAPSHRETSGPFFDRNFSVSSSFFPAPLGDNAVSFLDSEISPQLGEFDLTEQKVPLPLQNAIAMRTSDEILSGGISITATSQPADSSASIAAADPTPQKKSAPRPAEPKPLDIETAVPLNEKQLEDQKTIRAIIDEELSNLSEEQRDVWFESLKNEQAEDVAGILKMWNAIGGPDAESQTLFSFDNQTEPDAVKSGETEQEPTTRAATTPPAADFSAASRAAIEQAIRIRKRNIAMAFTPGFVRTIPAFFESLENDGDPGETSLVLRPVLEFNASRLTATGFPMDLAIAGPGMFVVRDNAGKTFYTRLGRFSLSPDRKLVLKAGDRTLTLQPEVQLPEDFETLSVSPSGEIHFEEAFEPADVEYLTIGLPMSSGGLKEVAAGLFQLADTHEQSILIVEPGKLGSGTISQRMIEVPHVDVQAELEAIAVLKSLLD